MEFFDEHLLVKVRDFIGESLSTGGEDDRPVSIAYHGDGDGLYGRGRQVFRGP